MKKIVGIRIEEAVIRCAKRRTAEEGRSLSQVIQDALVPYLYRKVPEPRKRKGAYQIFCDQPMRITKNQLKKILEADGNE